MSPAFWKAATERGRCIAASTRRTLLFVSSSCLTTRLAADRRSAGLLLMSSYAYNPSRLVFQNLRNPLWCAMVFVSLLAVFWLTPASAATTADPNASPMTRVVLDYLTGLSSKADHRLISGQWCCFGSVGTADIQRIHDVTDQWVGLVGADYYGYTNTPSVM